MENRVKVCWLTRKYKEKHVCFIPFTVDGTGKNGEEALENLKAEMNKIIKALRKSNVKCNFTEEMVDKAIDYQLWWRKKFAKEGRRWNGDEQG
jgi:hypothetical protein